MSIASGGYSKNGQKMQMCFLTGILTKYFTSLGIPSLQH